MYTLGTGFTSGSTYIDNFCLPWVPGCTDPGASNYDPLANADDGSCLYGCIASDTTSGKHMVVWYYLVKRSNKYCGLDCKN